MIYFAIVLGEGGQVFRDKASEANTTFHAFLFLKPPRPSPKIISVIDYLYKQ